MFHTIFYQRNFSVSCHQTHGLDYAHTDQGLVPSWLTRGLCYSIRITNQIMLCLPTMVVRMINGSMKILLCVSNHYNEKSIAYTYIIITIICCCKMSKQHHNFMLLNMNILKSSFLLSYNANSVEALEYNPKVF